MHGVSTYVTWKNRLPSRHILPVDDTIPTAIPRKHKGIPTVVHLHGGIDEPQSDGNSHSWFTARLYRIGLHVFQKNICTIKTTTIQAIFITDEPCPMVVMTRVNILAGLFGAYIIRDNKVEAPLGLPCGDEFDRTLIVVDRSFRTNGSIYMDTKGNNPSIHPVWQPEYFGDVIIVNGKAWPYMNVRRRKYRFRIINSSNASIG
ncbi:multicopper oxidase LPR1-like protein [Tanacetum coccineum]